MKATTLRTLVGVATPLILTGSVQAGFLGISTVSKPNEFGLLVVNVYAEFDRPPTPDPSNPGGFIQHDYMQSVVGTANAPLLIQVIGGTFYNHFLNGDQAPLTSLVGAFPIAAFDTFATIGVKQLIAPGGPGPGQPVDALTLTPEFDPIEGTQYSTTTGGWAIIPDAAQADPFNPDFVGGDGRVLFGQFSTADGSAIQGTMSIGIFDNGLHYHPVVSFFPVPGPGDRQDHGCFWFGRVGGQCGARVQNVQAHDGK